MQLSIYNCRCARGSARSQASGLSQLREGVRTHLPGSHINKAVLGNRENRWRVFSLQSTCEEHSTIKREKKRGRIQRAETRRGDNLMLTALNTGGVGRRCFRFFIRKLASGLIRKEALSPARPHPLTAWKLRRLASGTPAQKHNLLRRGFESYCPSRTRSPSPSPFLFLFLADSVVNIIFRKGRKLADTDSP